MYRVDLPPKTTVYWDKCFLKLSLTHHTCILHGPNTSHLCLILTCVVHTALSHMQCSMRWTMGLLGYIWCTDHGYTVQVARMCRKQVYSKLCPPYWNNHYMKEYEGKESYRWSGRKRSRKPWERKWEIGCSCVSASGSSSHLFWTFLLLYPLLSRPEASHSFCAR